MTLLLVVVVVEQVELMEQMTTEQERQEPKVLVEQAEMRALKEQLLDRQDQHCKAVKVVQVVAEDTMVVVEARKYLPAVLTEQVEVDQVTNHLPFQVVL